MGAGPRHDTLDQIASLAAGMLAAPVALVTLVERDRQLFLAGHGLDATETGRAESFCGHCITSQSPLRVADSIEDPRFAMNPLVLGPPHVRSYLGIPLFAGPAQSAIGTLCAIDSRPRAWSPEEEQRLRMLAALAERYLDDVGVRRAWESSPLSMLTLDGTGRCVRANPAFSRMLGHPSHAALDGPLAAHVIAADRGVLSAMIRHVVTHRESPTRRELRFVRLNGEIVHGGTSMAPELDHPDHVVCVIRDISLERRSTAQSGVVAQVRSELGLPLARARSLARALAVGGSDAQGDRPASEPSPDAPLLRQLDEFDAILDARLGDISARARAEEELHASEQRLRAVMEHVLGPLLVIDDRGRIVDANRAAMDELGWPYEELVGASLRRVFPAFSDEACRRWFDERAERAGGELATGSRDAQFVRRDGTARTFELRMLAMEWNGPGRMVLLLRDVTAAQAREATLVRERDDLEVRVRTGNEALTALQKVERALESSLEEKETLLKEIHHRVKNNLQMVSSLLTLQMDQMPDERARELLVDSVRRVRSMALIHQHLYGTASLERIDLGTYARDLAESLRAALSPNTALRVDADSVEVRVELAAPVCLILNELITNALKYGGRPADRAASLPKDAPDATADVLVEVRVEGNRVTVRVRDRGPGLPHGFDFKRGNSLGLQLVTTLTRQIRGRIAARSEGGAVFELEFSR